MRLRLAFVLCLATVLVLPARAASPLPRVALQGDPVVVRGFNFLPREPVRLLLVAHGRFHRRVVASSTGSFRLVFADASAKGCGVFSVTATGNRGSRAYLKRTVGCPETTTP